MELYCLGDSLTFGYGVRAAQRWTTLAEINQPYVEQKGIRVVRRLSGGGAVYHDLGNLNFTFIADAQNAEEINFSLFCRPVLRTLAALGVKAELNGRTDMTIDGMKFSGNSQYLRHGRVLQHMEARRYFAGLHNDQLLELLCKG